MFGTFVLDNVNAGWSAIFIQEDFTPEHAVVSHEITCQGRDHIATIRSGEGVLVIVNVHFEPDLVLRDLRERFRRISLHWPHYPEVLGVTIGDFNICEPEKGRFNVRTQTFTEGDAGKTALFRSFFQHALEIAQPNFTRRIPPLMVRFAHYPESTERFLMYLWQRRSIFNVIPMFLTTQENGPYRVIML